MTLAQRERVRGVLSGIAPNGGAAHHGDCLGADAEFHDIVCSLPGWTIIGHPPVKTTLRAYCIFDETRPPQDYLVRNVDIVEACNFLIAAPGSKIPESRSGTWFTIRRAKMVGRKHLVIYPDGSGKWL